jgi:hypothetical protein
VTKIVRGGESGSLDNINSSQATFRTQISALTDAVRQLGGAAEIGAGAVINDPLSAPYVLYVNPYTGSDKFVGGNYSTSGNALQRIELQRLECGYTEARPFKTINRAIIEAGIITAKSYYTQPLANNDLVSIVLMSGAATVFNGTGAASVSEWAATKTPTDAELQEFNPNSTGGILLPRGVSLCGLDLRKTIIRPDFVPAVADEASDASNRRAVFKVTGTGYYFGFTFMDKAGSTASHHLLDCFQFASQAELDEFYTKITQAFGGANNTGGINNALAVTNVSEYQIVGPQPAAGSQAASTDTTLSASPYIFNCSIRSSYGLCGIYADGAKVSGFRSMVVAQFTGVSLQRDLSCWQKYDSGASPRWGSTFSNYADYISTDPDNVRMHPSRRSFHIRVVNNAIIQEVSVFAIGQGIHHWTQNGGEITITNSNSNFGGCAAVSEGYRSSAFASDTNWNVSRLRVGANLTDLANNVRRIYLGTISAVTSSTITLTTALGDSLTVPGVPDLVARDGYTLRNGSYVWVENPLGDDWRTTFTSSAWSVGTPSQLNISAAPLDENGSAPGVNDQGNNRAIGKRVYIRRLVDTRTPEQRRFTLKLNTTDAVVRTPLRDYALQVVTGAPSINNLLPTSATITVSSATRTPVAGGGVTSSAEIILRRANSSVDWTAGAYYRKGETVKRNDKHYTCITDNADTTFNADKWEESYVHMASTYNPEDFYKTEAPILVFDNDTSGVQDSTTLGYNLTTVWNTDALIQNQYRTAADYRGAHLLLTALGFSSNQAHTILTPKPEASRDRDPSNSTDMGGFTPTGAASALDNWPIEFRRPSVVRLFGHAWEWAGFLNYTKAIPAYQGELSPQNKFTYYFTNVDGGRVYATGFNEEGFQVTPRGLEDIATGTTLSVENLGASDITLDQPTELSNLTLGGTTTINDNLVINAANVSFTSGFSASTTRAGIGEIASISEIEQSSLVTTDTGLNGAGANFITAAGLKYWASWAKVLTQRSGAANFYVVPDNAVNGGTYNFDGTSATLTLDPDRSGSAISVDPPTSRARAVRLSRAVEYVNANYSSLETANYFLANGPYWTAVTFNHIANVYGATLQFPAANVVASYGTANTTPTTNVKALVDAYALPCFATVVGYGSDSDRQQLYYYAAPVSLQFSYGGSVTGVAWQSVAKTLADTTNYPNSLFTMAPYRTPGVTLGPFIDSHARTFPSSYTFALFWGYPNIYAGAGSLVVQDCIFGAKAPGLGYIGYGDLGPTIRPIANTSLTLRGIYLLGNTSLSATDLPLTIAKGLTINGSGIYGTRNTQCFIGSRTDGSLATDVGISFAGRHAFNFVGGDAERNYDGNCIHILDNNGYYGLLSNRAATNGSRGATMTAIIGEMSAGSRVFTGGYGSYQINFTIANKHHGFAGAFGNDSSSLEGPVGISGGLDPLNFYRFASYHGSVWQQAVTAARLTSNTTLTYAPGVQANAYTNSYDNPLNIRSSVFFRGIDTDTAQLVGGELESVTVGGTPRFVFYG